MLASCLIDPQMAMLLRLKSPDCYHNTLTNQTHICSPEVHPAPPLPSPQSAEQHPPIGPPPPCNDQPNVADSTQFATCPRRRQSQMTSQATTVARLPGHASLRPRLACGDVRSGQVATCEQRHHGSALSLARRVPASDFICYHGGGT